MSGQIGKPSGPEMVEVSERDPGEQAVNPHVCGCDNPIYPRGLKKVPESQADYGNRDEEVQNRTEGIGFASTQAHKPYEEYWQQQIEVLLNSQGP